MSPPEQDDHQLALLSLSDAGYLVDGCMTEYELARMACQHRRERLCTALLDAAMYAGMSTSQMARITGYSRRQIRRLLRDASALL